MGDEMNFHSRQFEEVLLSMLPADAQDVSIVINQDVDTRKMPDAGFYSRYERTGYAAVTIIIRYFDPALVSENKEQHDVSQTNE